jgi:hypothetical protein
MNTPLHGRHDDVQRRELAVRQFARLHDAACSLQRLDTCVDALGAMEIRIRPFSTENYGATRRIRSAVVSLERRRQLATGTAATNTGIGPNAMRRKLCVLSAL